MRSFGHKASLATYWEIWSPSASRFATPKQLLGVLGGSWELQNRSWANLGSFPTRQSDLGLVLERFWGPKWSSWEALGSSKIDLEGVSGPLGCVKAIVYGFGSVYETKMKAQIRPKRTKISICNEHNIHTCARIGHANFEWLLQCLSCHNGIAEVLNLMKVASCKVSKNNSASELL